MLSRLRERYRTHAGTRGSLPSESLRFPNVSRKKKMEETSRQTDVLSDETPLLPPLHGILLREQQRDNTAARPSTHRSFPTRARALPVEGAPPCTPVAGGCAGPGVRARRRAH